MKYALAIVLALVSSLALAAGTIALGGLLEFVVYLVVVGLIFWCIWWFLGYVGVLEPFNKVLRVILGLIALLIVVNLLLGLVGSPMFNFR